MRAFGSKQQLQTRLSPITLDKEFAANYTDSETGLIYYGKRYYNPSQGRFINRDPIGETGGNNLYGFCGNDGVDRSDFLGNSWFSDLWDHTALSLSQHLGSEISSLQRWSNANPVASNFLALGDPMFGNLAGNFDAHVTWHAAQRNPQLASVVAAIAATWYLGGWGAGFLDVSDIEQTVIAGAASGFGGGFVGAEASGAPVGQSFEAGAEGGSNCWGDGLCRGEYFGAQYTSFSVASATRMFATSEIAYEMGRASQRYLGINGLEFDAALEAVSFIGNAWLGPRLHTDIDGNAFISGFWTRPITGNTFINNLIDTPFDVADTLLNYQGIPSATELDVAYNHIPVLYGHSLGALGYSTLAAEGSVTGGRCRSITIIRFCAWRSGCLSWLQRSHNGIRTE